MNEQHFRELSAARALHALSPEEERAFSEALAAHPEWQRVVDEDLETAGSLGAASAAAEPPAASRAAILDLVSRSPQFEPPAQDARGGAPGAAHDAPEPRNAPAPPGGGASPEADAPRARRRAGWFALAASIAVLLAVAIALPLRGALEAQDPVTIALQQVGSAGDARTSTVELADGGEATLHWSDSEQQAVLVADGMQPAPDDHDYELWIVRGDQPISLGVMRAEDDGDAAVLADGFEPGDAVAVTVEQQGGSPTGLPTTDPVVVIATA
ncbi:anti-sigma factor [Leucobacter triazinivorans]|uniref:Regulator of SigK n=1 Tax=Leucobacter triazinivorans TaxID=1784719 RepID=A0A4P6KF51_9MICO|nr:anti-sigma factor [Leucobacter triazinivorans]QBE49027.1 anti-sigma factor [Leucobacter triazinivorans]